MKVTLQTTLRAAVLLGTSALTLPSITFGDNSQQAPPITVTPILAQGAIPTESDTEVILKLQICGHDTGAKKQNLPLNVAIVLDRSGSMAGSKIEQAKQAASHLVNHLSAKDRFSLVTYDDRVDVLIPPAPVLKPQSLVDRIASITPGGSTALYAGVSAGAEQLKTFLSAERINRIILLSDGIANVGPSSPAEISALGRTLASSGIPVTTIGLGENYQEDVLSSLAEASDANYYYISDIEKLPGIFNEEFEELQSIVARDVHIRLECAEGVTPIGFAGRAPGTTTLTFSSVSAKQQRDVFFRCRVSSGSTLETRDIAKILTEWTSKDGSTTLLPPQSARLAIVSSPAEAEAHADSAVFTDYQILTANLEKKEAIAAADAGKGTIARSKLSSLRDKIAALLPSAPAEKQISLQEEMSKLETSITDIDQNRGRMSRGNRKALQSQSWKKANAKK